MSRRPGNQSLEEPIDQILKGIEYLNKALYARIDNGGWEKEHLREVSKVITILESCKPKLRKIKSETY